MTCFYRVAPESYEEGEDLLSYDALVAHGRDPAWKWDQVYAETNVVALFRHSADARGYQQDHGGTIYSVYLPEDFEREYVRPNREGFPSVSNCIPRKYVSRWKDTRYS